MKKSLLVCAVLFSLIGFAACDEKIADNNPKGVWEVYSATTDESTQYNYPDTYSFDLKLQTIEVEMQMYFKITDEKFMIISYIDSELTAEQSALLKKYYGYVNNYYVETIELDSIDKTKGRMLFGGGEYCIQYKIEKNELIVSGSWLYKSRKSSKTFSKSVESEDYTATEDFENGLEFQNLELEKDITMVNQSSDTYGSVFYGKVDLVAGTQYYVTSDSFDDNDFSSYSGALKVTSDENLTNEDVDLGYYTASYFDPKVFFFTATKTGTYYFKIQDSDLTTITCRVSTACSNRLQNAVEVKEGIVSTQMFYTDTEEYYYRAKLDASKKYYFSCDKLNGYEMNILIIDKNFKSQDLSELDTELVGDSCSFLCSFTPETAGEYYVVVSSYLYSYSWTESANTDNVNLYLNTEYPANADTISLNTEFQWVSGSNYVFDAVAGTKYYIYTPHSDLYTDMSLECYSGENFRNYSYDSMSSIDILSGTDYLSFVATETGKALMNIYLSPSTLTGKPKFTVDTTLPAETPSIISVDQANKTPVAAVSGTLTGTSSDLYEITIDSNDSCYLYTSGNTYCSMMVIAENGTTSVGKSSNSGDRYDRSFRFKAAGKYYIRIYSSVESHAGIYDLCFVSDDHGDYLNSATTMTDSTVSGILSPYSFDYKNYEYAYDCDCFSVSLTAGTTYTIETSGSVDTVGFLYNSPSASSYLNTQTSGGEGKNFKIVYSCPVTGNYIIAVRSENYGYGSYTLHVTH